MPLLRLLLVLVPIARRLLRDPRVRARLGLGDRGGSGGGSRSRPRRR